MMRKENLGGTLLFTISLVATLAYLRLGLVRVFYPYALDLVEEGMVMQAWRVAQDLPVYVPPNGEFVPQVYMPLFTWLGGHLMRLTGFGFWPLRLLSLLSTVGTAVLIAALGWGESGSKTAAFAGSSLFLAGYRLVGGWFDLARVDALFTCLSLAGLALLVWRADGPDRTQRDLRRALKKEDASIVLGAILLGLAFLTKQNGLFLAAVGGFYLFAVEMRKNFVMSALRRVFLTFVVPFSLVSVVPILLLEQTSHGWFRYYVVTIAYASPLDLGRLRNIFLWELGAGMGILVGFAAVLVGLLTKRFFRHLVNDGWRWVGTIIQSTIVENPWLLFVATAVFISVAGRSTVGGNLNNLIVGYAFLCLLPGEMFGLLSTKPQVSQPGLFGHKFGHKYASIALVSAIIFQFGLATFPINRGLPRQFLPTTEMRSAGDLLQARVDGEAGEVWLLMHPSFAVRSEKRPYVHLQSLWHARQRGAAPLPSDLTVRLEDQQFALIVSDESDFFETEPAFLAALLASYEIVETLSPAQSPPTMNEPVIRPSSIYVPRR